MGFDIKEWRRQQLTESTGFKSEKMTESERKETLEAVSKFNEYGNQIYKSESIAEMVENIKKLAENASKMAMQEDADWFDNVSVKRDMKGLGDAMKVFEATAKESATLQQRMESMFEEIGGKLGKYYEIKELNETEAQDKYQAKFKDALDDEGVDSPADLDDKEKKDFFNKVDKMHKGKSEAVNKLKNKVNEAFEGLRSVVSVPGVGINMNQPKKKTIKEGFETWEMSFAAMNLSGVELRPEKKYKVSARTTIEAIKKASKMAGLKGNDWMATVTNTLKKL